jgi:hypothetical protein
MSPANHLRTNSCYLSVRLIGSAEERNLVTASILPAIAKEGPKCYAGIASELCNQPTRQTLNVMRVAEKATGIIQAGDDCMHNCS